MPATSLLLRLLLAVAMATATIDVAAQQVTVSTPYHAINESFFENMGVSWGLRGRGWSLSLFGSPFQAAPQFGGFDPSAGLNFGFGFARGGVNGFFNANFAQGTRRTFTSQTSVVTLQNGVPGGVFDTSQSPFVIGYRPVVGGFPIFGSLMPAAPQPLQQVPGTTSGETAVRDALQLAEPRPEAKDAEGGSINPAGNDRAQQVNPPPAPAAQAPGRNDDLVLVGGADPPAKAMADPSDQVGRQRVAAQASSADRPAMSVAEAKRAYAAEQAQNQGEVLEYLERGRHAEAIGKPNVARIYYQMAHRRAPAQLRPQIQARLEGLEAAPADRP